VHHVYSTGEGWVTGGRLRVLVVDLVEGNMEGIKHLQQCLELSSALNSITMSFLWSFSEEKKALLSQVCIS